MGGPPPADWLAFVPLASTNSTVTRAWFWLGLLRSKYSRKLSLVRPSANSQVNAGSVAPALAVPALGLEQEIVERVGRFAGR